MLEIRWATDRLRSSSTRPARERAHAHRLVRRSARRRWRGLARVPRTCSRPSSWHRAGLAPGQRWGEVHGKYVEAFGPDGDDRPPEGWDAGARGPSTPRAEAGDIPTGRTGVPDGGRASPSLPLATIADLFRTCAPRHGPRASHWTCCSARSRSIVTLPHHVRPARHLPARDPGRGLLFVVSAGLGTPSAAGPRRCSG
jgi:hypothetical protein